MIPVDGRLVGVARRLQCTEGQVESMIVGLAVLVAATLLGLSGVDWMDFRNEQATASPATSSPSGATEQPPQDPRPFVADADSAPQTSMATTTTDPFWATTTTSAPPVVAAPPPTRPTEPTPECDARDVIDATDAVLAALAAAGDLLPVASVSDAVASVLGCSDTPAAIALVGILVEIGRALPDPGLPQVDVIPPLPQIPSEALGPLAPLAPIFIEGCSTVQTVIAVLQLVTPAYPYPVGGEEFASLLLEASVLCGRLSTLG